MFGNEDVGPPCTYLEEEKREGMMSGDVIPCSRRRRRSLAEEGKKERLEGSIDDETRRDDRHIRRRRRKRVHLLRQRCWRAWDVVHYSSLS